MTPGYPPGHRPLADPQTRPPSSAGRRDPHGRFAGPYHGWRSPLPALSRAGIRRIADAEVLERVAAAIDVELGPELDGRRLRRLNSAVNRYRLERRALARTGRAERYTSRLAVARSLYGPDVELDDVKRQLRRIEADLAAAGLLEVHVATGRPGESRGLLVRLLDPEPPPPATPELEIISNPGQLARAYLARRAETRAERRARRVAPWRRQQSDRRSRGGVPGLYVRRSLSIAPPGLGSGAVRDYVPRPRCRADSERDARPRLPAPRRGGHAQGPSIEPEESRAGKAPPPRHRWAALSALRQVASRERGLERLRGAAVGGGPPCSIAVAAWEALFLADPGPGGFGWGWGDGTPPGDPWAEDRRRHGELVDAGHDALEPPPPRRYLGLSERWADRLEAACRRYDRAAGQPGAGLLTLLADLESWRPEHGAPRSVRHGPLNQTAGEGWPCSLAYFVSRLKIRARQIHHARDQAANEKSIDWSLDQEPGGRLRPWAYRPPSSTLEDLRDDWHDALDAPQDPDPPKP